MRRSDCQNLRSEVDEAVAGELLSPTAERHLSACHECRIFSEQHDKLQSLLSSLGTVEAPGDFDFRLRARLAGDSPRSAHFQPWNLSLGLRSAVVATLFVVIGAVVLLNLPTSRDNSLSAGNVTSSATEGAGAIATQPETINANPLAATASIAQAPRPSTPVGYKVGTNSNLIAHVGNTPRIGTRDMGSRPATLIRTADLNAQADFPIEASSQPMKVSLDNGRGSSRTISLPPVSFGSQRVLSQGPVPLMASARGSW